MRGSGALPSNTNWPPCSAVRKMACLGAEEKGGWESCAIDALQVPER